MKKKVLLTILFASCLTIFAAFTLTGCGTSEDEYEGTLDEGYDDEYYEEEYDEEYDDPYGDGMTLEDAKVWDDGSVFIMDNDVFYPLLPAYRGESLGIEVYGVYGKEESDALYYTPSSYSYYGLPVLSKDAKLVEVRQEDGNGSITYLPGETGWTIPYTFSYHNSNYHATDESKNDYTHSAELWKNIDDDTLTYLNDVRSINNNPLDFSKIHETALELGKLDYDKAFASDSDDFIEAVKAPDWKAICKTSDMKPLSVGLDRNQCYCNMILDVKKDAEVDVSYRNDGSVDTETEYAYADCRYYNLPTNISSPEHVKTFNNEYTETENGYSIIKTPEMDSGIYLYTNRNDVYWVFQVK